MLSIHKDCLYFLFKYLGPRDVYNLSLLNRKMYYRISGHWYWKILLREIYDITNTYNMNCMKYYLFYMYHIENNRYINDIVQYDDVNLFEYFYRNGKIYYYQCRLLIAYYDAINIFRYLIDCGYINSFQIQAYLVTFAQYNSVRCAEYLLRNHVAIINLSLPMVVARVYENVDFQNVIYMNT